MVTMLDPLILGIAAGIVGAIIIFTTTLSGIYGKSKAYKIFKDSIWGSYGYKATWGGAIIGAILGFIYAGVIVGVTALIYNLLI